MYLCGMRSRYHLNSQSKRVGFVDNLNVLSEAEEPSAAHGDSLNYLLSRLPPEQLLGLNAQMARRMIMMRCFESSRLDPDPPGVLEGRTCPWLVAVDGTELRTYDRRHCPHCLVRTLSNGRKQYFHSVLEARLITFTGVTVSLGSVAIRNEDADYDKQDCELKAFPRLARQLKQRFPRLRICILADSLYGCKPFLDICRDMKWDYIVVFKEGRTPALWERAVRKRDRSTENRRKRIEKSGVRKRYSWATCLEHGGHTVHAAFCEETSRKGKTTNWAWLTSHRPADYNIEKLTDKGGRKRWKIENEGFNLLKNGETGLRHDYGSTGHAWYNYYLLAQVALLLLQLIWRGDLVRKAAIRAYGTARNLFGSMRELAEMLGESLQRDRLAQVCDGLDPAAIQIRFDTS